MKIKFRLRPNACQVKTGRILNVSPCRPLLYFMPITYLDVYFLDTEKNVIFTLTFIFVQFPQTCF
jgi:hypothetical protein